MLEDLPGRPFRVVTSVVELISTHAFYGLADAGNQRLNSSRVLAYVNRTKHNQVYLGEGGAPASPKSVGVSISYCWPRSWRGRGAYPRNTSSACLNARSMSGVQR